MLCWRKWGGGGGIDASLEKINVASDQVGDYVAYSEKQARRTATLFLVTVVVSALIVVGTLWWSHYITRALAHDKADLAVLDAELKRTPVMVHFKGTYYVRIVPHSVTGFTRKDGSDAPGQYARLWTVR